MLSHVLTKRHRYCVFGLVLASGLTLATACSNEKEVARAVPTIVRRSALATGPSGAIQVHVYAYSDGGGVRYALPDVTVNVVDASTGATMGSAISDKSGLVEVVDLPAPASYQLCWSKPNFTSACAAPFPLAPELSSQPPVMVAFTLGAIHGQIDLADGSPVYFQNDGFAVSVSTTIWARDARGVTFGPVLANTQGQYVLPALPAGKYQVVAQSGPTQTPAATALVNASATSVNLKLPNRRPQIADQDVYVNGVRSKRATPGAQVNVVVGATDPDGDPLHYVYSVGTDTSACGAVDSSSVVCTLNAGAGLQSIFVMVSDGRGEYQAHRVDVRTDAGGELFTGTVTTPAGSPLSGVTATVNGLPAETNLAGAFGVEVPPTDRYVMVLKKPGYQTYSRIYFSAITGATYSMIPVVAQVVDPTTDIHLVERTGDKLTRQRPATVDIPANSLVCGRSRLPAAGPLTAYLSTIDRRDPEDRMPGDSTAMDGSGAIKRLVSYGAVEASFVDAAGRACNLLRGTQAVITAAVYPEQAAGAPAAVPLWYYEEATGLWKEYGADAALVRGAYSMTVPHFTIVNADRAFGSADSDCMVVNVDEAQLPLYPNGIRLHLRFADGSGFAPNHDDVIQDNPSVIARLPANTDVTVSVVDKSGAEIAGSKVLVHTGQGGGGSITPDKTVCQTSVTLTRSGPSGEPAAGFFSAKPTLQVDGDAYYDKIDPPNPTTNARTRDTFDKWKQEVGFRDPAPPHTEHDEAHAYYFNAGDLHFGRSMHLVHMPSGGVAYYVTNYDSAEQAARASSGLTVPPKATVAMEYAPGSFTKFFIFDGGGQRISGIDLDYRHTGAAVQNKFVPGLCNTCHGGLGSYAANGDSGGRFIGFDLSAFGYTDYDPAASGPSSSSPFRRVAQEAQFATLNKTLRETNLSYAYGRLIGGWYQANPLQQDSTYVPDGGALAFPAPAALDSEWSGHSDLYLNVIKPSCRSCHASRNDQVLDWHSLSALQNRATSVHARVCSTRDMPNAYLTWFNFWQSALPQQPVDLMAALNQPACP